jgi:hypothetical protein
VAAPLTRRSLPDALVDLALACSALAAWHIRFGTFGPNFNSDAALHGAMV